MTKQDRIERGRLARRRLSLHFVNKHHENEFRAEWRRTSLFQVRVAIVLGVGLTLLFIPIDRQHMPPDALAVLTAWRVFVIIPLLIGGLLVASHGAIQPFIFTYCSVGIAVASFGYPLAAKHVTPDQLMYFSTALTQFMVFNFVLFRIPFYSSVLSGLAIFAGFMVCVSSWGQPTWLSISVIVGFLVITIMLILGAYQRDTNARDLYESKLRWGESQREKIDWLRSFTRFIKHELGNQLIGIRSSMDLAARHVVGEDSKAYISRAKTSMDRMRGLLVQAADATSLEAALQHEERIDLEFDLLVRERVEAFREAYPSWKWTLHTEESWVSGNAIRLVQMIDNLLKNATDHGSRDGKIEIRVNVYPDSCEFTIENDGPALPDGATELFGAWKLSADSAAYGNHFGVGLFIAMKVAENHGGSIAATRRVDNTGARFTVVLPRLRNVERPSEQNWQNVSG